MELIDEQDCRARIRKHAVKSIRAALDLMLKVDCADGITLLESVDSIGASVAQMIGCINKIQELEKK